MAITKAQKDEILKGYVDMLKSAQGLIVTEYRGMSMKSFNATRKAMRAVEGRYTVAKNTLFKIALHESGMAAPEELFSGPVAVAISYGDLGTLTKAVLQNAKENELLVLKGAVMGTTVFRADQLEALSTLPSLDQARATLIGTLNQPASQFVSLINQPAQGLAAILKAYTDKAEGGQSEAA